MCHRESESNLVNQNWTVLRTQRIVDPLDVLEATPRALVRVAWRCCCLALLLGMTTVAVGAATETKSPTARVLEIKGKVAIVSPDRPDRAAAMFSVVYADDRLVTAKGAQATLIFRSDGHIERVAAAGTFRVTPSGCQPNVGIEQVAMSDPNQAVVAKISKGPGGIVQGGAVVARTAPQATSSSSPHNGNFRESPTTDRTSPISESTVRSAKPTFLWRAEPRAGTYTVNLYYRSDRIWSASTESPRLEYAAENPLKAGAMYSWEVTTILDGEPAKVYEGVFYTANDRQLAEAAGLEELLAKPDALRLSLAAIWYKQNHFVSEAIAVHEQLAKISNDPAVYWSLSELCWRGGREADAKAAASKAAELDKKAGAGGEKAEEHQPTAAKK